MTEGADMKSNLIGKEVRIKKNIDSFFAGEWGTVVSFDGELYEVAMYNGCGCCVFERSEFTVKRS